MEVKVRMAKDGGFEINHKMAGSVPLATYEEQLVLMNDIDKNGQQLPIVLWKGEIVDGRCRQKALLELGNHILYSELDDELTEDEVLVYVKSVNTRRNLTITQKAFIVALGVAKGTLKNVAEGARAWGVSRGNASNAKWIYDNFQVAGDSLFNGKSIEIINSSGKKVKSSNVKAVYAYLRKLGEAEETKGSTIEFFNWEAEKAFKKIDFKEMGHVKTQMARLLNENEELKGRCSCNVG